MQSVLSGLRQLKAYHHVVSNRDVNEANSHEADPKIALVFSAKYYNLDHFLQKNIQLIIDRTSKISVPNGL